KAGRRAAGRWPTMTHGSPTTAVGSGHRPPSSPPDDRDSTGPGCGERDHRVRDDPVGTPGTWRSMDSTVPRLPQGVAVAGMNGKVCGGDDVDIRSPDLESLFGLRGSRSAAARLRRDRPR